MTATFANQCNKLSTKTLPIKKRPQKRTHCTSCLGCCSVSVGHTTTMLPLVRRFDPQIVESFPAIKAPILNQSSTMSKSKKKVHFAHFQAVRTREASAEDLINSWYDDRHYRYFEADNRDSIARYHAGAEVDLKSLEHYAGGKEQIVSRRMHTLKHVAVVVELYDVQRCCGAYDDEMIRRVSERLSEDPTKRAYLRAN